MSEQNLDLISELHTLIHINKIISDISVIMSSNAGNGLDNDFFSIVLKDIMNMIFDCHDLSGKFRKQTYILITRHVDSDNWNYTHELNRITSFIANHIYNIRQQLMLNEVH